MLMHYAVFLVGADDVVVVDATVYLVDADVEVVSVAVDDLIVVVDANVVRLQKHLGGIFSICNVLI